jgi:hypothetical protein
MARQEQDREDLLREATALVERVEFLLPDLNSVVVGFRRNGCASVFFEQDPAYHFNGANELRRAYVAERLYKAERRRLVAMTRVRTASEVQLVRHELTHDEAAVFLDSMYECLAQLAERLDSGGYTLVGQFPDDANVALRARQWLANLPARVPIAVSPRAL